MSLTLSRGMVGRVTASGAAAPTVTAAGVTPNVGDTAGGGQPVTIPGTGFVSGCTVTFDGVSATSVIFGTSTSITCVPPAGSTGTADIVVTNPDTQTSGASGNAAYEYWTPAQITSIDSYLDSNKGVTDAGAGAVSAWLDQANALNFVQGTGANRPTQTASVFGTLPSIRFVPQDWVRLGTPRPLLSGQSVFFVGKWTSSDATPEGLQVALAVVSDAVGAYNGFGAAADQLSYQAYDTAGGTPHIVSRGSSLNDGVTRLCGITVNTTPDEKFYVGTVQQGSTNSPAGGYPTSNAGYNSIGVGYPDVDGWHGDLGAVVVVSGVMSGGDMTKLHKWSQQRFGAAA